MKMNNEYHRKINDELFGEIKNKQKNKNKEQWIILIQLFSLYPRILLLKLSFITETFTIGKPNHSPSLNVS